ncbi:hypothetical protein [Trichothermofontia sp.]
MFLACAGRQPRLGTDAALRKIKFDLARISPAGLIGPPDGLRSFSYEFCAPATESVIQQIRAIDTSLQFYRQSPGRIGCRADQVLAIGETHQPHWQKVLIHLANFHSPCQVALHR